MNLLVGDFLIYIKLNKFYWHNILLLFIRFVLLIFLKLGLLVFQLLCKTREKTVPANFLIKINYQ